MSDLANRVGQLSQLAAQYPSPEARLRAQHTALRAKLAALEQEMRTKAHEPYWADRIAALLQETP